MIGAFALAFVSRANAQMRPIDLPAETRTETRTETGTAIGRETGTETETGTQAVPEEPIGPRPDELRLDGTDQWNPGWSLEFGSAGRFARERARHLVLVHVRATVPGRDMPLLDGSLLARGVGLGVWLTDPNGRARLFTSAALLVDTVIEKVTWNGRPLTVRRLVPIGDGGLIELVVDERAQDAAILDPTPPPADRGPRPVFVVAPTEDPEGAPGASDADGNLTLTNKPPRRAGSGPRGAIGGRAPPRSLTEDERLAPAWARGLIVEWAEPPLDHLAGAEPRVVPGTPYFDATGRVVGIALRQSPVTPETISLILRGDVLREWLRPEGPPYDHDLPPAGAR